jgi:hypothetical protein
MADVPDQVLRRQLDFLAAIDFCDVDSHRVRLTIGEVAVTEDLRDDALESDRIRGLAIDIVRQLDVLIHVIDDTVGADSPSEVVDGLGSHRDMSRVRASDSVNADTIKIFVSDLHLEDITLLRSLSESEEAFDVSIEDFADMLAVGRLDKGIAADVVIGIILRLFSERLSSEVVVAEMVTAELLNSLH